MAIFNPHPNSKSLSRRQRREIIDDRIQITDKTAWYIRTHPTNRTRIAIQMTLLMVEGRLPLNLPALQAAYQDAELGRIWRGEVPR